MRYYNSKNNGNMNLKQYNVGSSDTKCTKSCLFWVEKSDWKPVIESGVMAHNSTKDLQENPFTKWNENAFDFVNVFSWNVFICWCFSWILCHLNHSKKSYWRVVRLRGNAMLPKLLFIRFWKHCCQTICQIFSLYISFDGLKIDVHHLYHEMIPKLLFD